MFVVWIGAFIQTIFLFLRAQTSFFVPEPYVLPSGPHLAPSTGLAASAVFIAGTVKAKTTKIAVAFLTGYFFHQIMEKVYL